MKVQAPTIQAPTICLLKAIDNLSHSKSKFHRRASSRAAVVAAPVAGIISSFMSAGLTPVAAFKTTAGKLPNVGKKIEARFPKNFNLLNTTLNIGRYLATGFLFPIGIGSPKTFLKICILMGIRFRVPVEALPKPLIDKGSKKGKEKETPAPDSVKEPIQQPEPPQTLPPQAKQLEPDTSNFLKKKVDLLHPLPGLPEPKKVKELPASMADECKKLDKRTCESWHTFNPILSQIEEKANEKKEPAPLDEILARRIAINGASQEDEEEAPDFDDGIAIPAVGTSQKQYVPTYVSPKSATEDLLKAMTQMQAKLKPEVKANEDDSVWE